MASAKKPISRRRKATPTRTDITTAVTGNEQTLDGLGSRIGSEVYRFIGDIELQLEKLFKTLTDSTGIEANRLREQALAKLGIAKAVAASLKNGALDRGRQYAQEADRFVRDQPWRAIGIGTAAGFTAGALLARRGSN